MTKLRIIFLSFIFLACTQISCAANNEATNYQAEAQALCEVFSPEFWSTVASDILPIEKQQLLADRISEATQSTEMKALVAKLPTIVPDERYTYYLSRTKELTGKEQLCPAIKNYFSF